MLVTLCSLHITNKLTIVGNSRSFKKVDFRTFKGRDLAHGELGIESFITVLLEIEGLDINRDTTVGSLEGGILAILFLKCVQCNTTYGNLGLGDARVFRVGLDSLKDDSKLMDGLDG